MNFVVHNGPIHPEALAAFEARYGRLPDDYREFLCTHNGGGLSGSAIVRVKTPDGPENWGIDGFYGIQDDMGAEGVALHTEFWDQDYPAGSIPVASDGTGNDYLMSVSGDSRGRVYFLDHERSSEAEKPIQELPCMASSFAEFIGGIQDFDPDDPGSEKLFHILGERRRKDAETLQRILAPKKPWWKFW